MPHVFNSRNGVRHGFVHGVFILCVTMAPIYGFIKAKLGLDGFLVASSDGVYLHGSPAHVALTISATPTL